MFQESREYNRLAGLAENSEAKKKRRTFCKVRRRLRVKDYLLVPENTRGD
jgi:hypothetical protein